jgi:adenylosuccinate synthase
VTKLDVLDGLDVIRVAVGYRYQGETVDTVPSGAEAMEAVEPVYEELAGWQESTVGATRLEDLPATAQAYLRRLEEVSGAPIDIVSTGPDRVETIVLRHPFD